MTNSSESGTPKKADVAFSLKGSGSLLTPGVQPPATNKEINKKCKIPNSIKKTVLIGITIAFLLSFFIIRPICNHLYDVNYKGCYDETKKRFMRNKFSNGTLYQIIDIDVQQIDYNSLGTNVYFEHFCNGVPVHSGKRVKAQYEHEFKTVITEADASYDDTGKGVTTLRTFNYSGNERKDITVRERGGRRYPNASATWRITYSVNPDLSEMKEPSYWEVVFWE